MRSLNVESSSADRCLAGVDSAHLTRCLVSGCEGLDPQMFLLHLHAIAQLNGIITVYFRIAPSRESLRAIEL